MYYVVCEYLFTCKILFIDSKKLIFLDLKKKMTDADHENQILRHLYYTDIFLCAAIFFFTISLVIVFSIDDAIVAFFILLSISILLLMSYFYHALGHCYESMCSHSNTEEIVGNANVHITNDHSAVVNV